MGISVRSHLFAATLACTLGSAAIPPHAGAQDAAADDARWRDVAGAAFPGRTIGDGAAVLHLDAPGRAIDASLVPVTITADAAIRPKSITLIIDGNPAPVAAIVHFGKLADPHLLRLRVRVNQYTQMHAVAELEDGRLIGTSRFIKAAGGCSAPGQAPLAEALARIGRMKLLPLDALAPGSAQTAELLISHPNLNGMQMDPITRLYTPARYVQTVSITSGSQSVFTLDGDISLAQDPAIGFAFYPQENAPLIVEVHDSDKIVFKATLPLPGHQS